MTLFRARRATSSTGTLTAWLLGAGIAAAQAHPLAPALLELAEVAPARYAVLWRTPVARAGAQDVAPRLPAHCEAASAPHAKPEGSDALVTRWIVRCGAALDGATIGVSGLADSGINAIVHVRAADGREARALLGADRPEAVIALDRESTFPRYFALGGEHLVTGLDHLVFLLGLIVLVPGLRMLVATVTAFTAGHSVTLAATTLGWLELPQSWAELAIAATVVMLALELARAPAPGAPAEVRCGGLRRRPWALAGAFGLIHGLGFAGALRDVGVPVGDIPLSLLAFNAGIEAAQLALVAVLLAAAAIWRNMARWVRESLRARLARLAVLPNAVGALGVCWCLERMLPLFR